MVEKINKIQRLQLELIRNASFNNFDGEQVVKDLVENKELWEGVVMWREAFSRAIDLICLRDISQDVWNVDTLFILVESKRKLNKLLQIVATWNADEVDVIKGEEAQDLLGFWSRKDAEKGLPIIVRVWWD